MIAYQNKEVDLHSRIAIPYKSIKPELAAENAELNDAYIISTVGKFIFNNIMPEHMPFIFNNSDEALDDNCKQYFVKPGTNIKEVINNLEINDPFTKKSIAKVIRRFFEKYVANTSLRQVALAIKPLDNKTGQDLAKLEKRFAEIPSLTANQTISKHHAKILAKLVFNEYKLMLKRIELENIQNHF